MQLDEIFAPNAVLTGVKATSKSQVLRTLADEVAAKHGLDATLVCNTLREREKLGTTAIGDGVAVPHGKVAGLDRLVGLVACLAQPVDFDALDDAPVDLVVLLLAPESAGAEHLRVLAQLSRLARDHQRCTALRDCSNAEALWATLTGSDRRNAA